MANIKKDSVNHRVLITMLRSRDKRIKGLYEMNGRLLAIIKKHGINPKTGEKE